MVLIEKWKKRLDKNGTCGAILTDLSKAFDCLPHDLLLAKLHAYGLNYNSLKLLSSYLSNRKQRVRLGNTFSIWHDILTGVPQGSILGPLLFNIFICDLFLFTYNVDIANYADDTTPYSCNLNTELVIKELENVSINMLNWFKCNKMKANPDKYHFLCTDNNALQINIGDLKIYSTTSEKLLGITIDSKLSFEQHVNNLCDKTSQKLNALARISKYIEPTQKRLIMKAFITSQFGYCPLVWMFHSRKINNRINRLHERALRLTYDDYTLNFDTLLELDRSVSIHQRNLQVLATLLYKITNQLSSEIVNEIFPFNNQPYYLRSRFDFQRENVSTVHYGTESLSFIAPKIWSIIPDEIKESPTLEIFKLKIKDWKTNECPCRLCKTYIAQIGFV